MKRRNNNKQVNKDMKIVFVHCYYSEKIFERFLKENLFEDFIMNI
jgi:hypothetical protein